MFSPYTAKELARHRTVLTRAARGDEEPAEDLHDSLVEGTQGLTGLTLVAGLVCAIAIWASRRLAHVPLSVLAALAAGALGFAGTLASVYGARLAWSRVRSVPRHGDFRVALLCALLIVAVVLTGRLAGSA
ncbi:hypothetical protein [Amycolatopsis sp. cmx-4-61]|uniref:hypothetical protein n=1 Tax=Amycolatopsis sp. cmx-4-61 TaxID=2790937 RepID=UPI00397B02A9